MAFFIEKPGDELGNTYRLPAVIEGEIVDHDLADVCNRIKIIGPPEIAGKWPVITGGNLVEIGPEHGPARMLTVEEWAAILGFKLPPAVEW